MGKEDKAPIKFCAGDAKEQAITSLLQACLFDCTSANLIETPQRVARVFDTLLSTPKPKLATFPLEGEPSMICVKEHTAWSFCPHHLLPVLYTFKIAYVPTKDVLGLSKLPRLADWAVRDMPLQEDIAPRIAKELKSINPLGVAVLVSGEHMCMRMRGVESACATAVTTFMTGIYLREPAAREEFLSL